MRASKILFHMLQFLQKITHRDRIVYVGMIALVALLPVFFLPLSGVAVEVGKIFLVELVAIFLLLAWLIPQLRASKLTIVRTPIGFSFLAFSLVVLVASALSPNFNLSFFGEAFGSAEGAFLASLGLLGFLASQVFTGFQRAMALYTAVILPFLGVALLQLIRFVAGSQVLSFGVLLGDTMTLLGDWHNLGLYSGFIVVVTLVGLELLNLKSSYRTLLWVVLGLSGLFLFIVNLPLAWVLVALAAFLLFLYKSAFRDRIKSKNRWRLPLISLVAFLLALAGYVALGSAAQGVLSAVRPVAQNEVRLSLETTLVMAGEAWSGNPVSGSGPNFFGYLWQETRNEIVSRAALSDVRFSHGYSFLATQLTVLGLAGGLVLLFILVRYLRLGVQSLFTSYDDRLLRFFSLSTFLLSFYLWAVLLFYVPGTTMLVYSFIFMGVFGGLMQGEAKHNTIHISLRSKKHSAIVAISAFLLVVGMSASVYILAEKMAGVISFRSAIYEEDVQSGYQKALRAARWTHAAPYYRSLASLVSQQATAYAGQVDIAENGEARTELEGLLGQSLAFAQESTRANPFDYTNWVLLGDIYATLDGYNVAGSYLNARQAYEAALLRNPKAHDVLGAMARLEISAGQTDSAQAIVNDMLLRRPSDAGAIVLAAQLAYARGDNEIGDSYLQNSILAVGNDINAVLQIGVFAYNQKRYELSRDIFASVLRVQENVDAALGLMYSLDANGEVEEARAIAARLQEIGVLQEDSSSEAPAELADTVTSETPQIADGNTDETIIEPDIEAASVPVEVDSEDN